MKQRMIKAGVLLMGLMIVFTIISRAAYNMSTAEVSTEKPEVQTFTPDISAQGTVTGRGEIAVSTVENLRIGAVHVMEGQTVEAGEVLFELDLQDLTEKMQEKQRELQSLDLQIRAAVESEAVSEENRRLAQSQTQEDYNRTAARENAAVDAAFFELKQAQEQYQNFIAGPQAELGQTDSNQAEFGQTDSNQAEFDQAGFGQVNSSQTAEELLAVVQEKQAAYDQALQSRDDSLYQAQKALDSAHLGTAKTYSVEQSQITRGQKEAEIAKLQTLLDVQGRVTAPVKGLVTNVTARVGSFTTGGGDILLSDASGGASLSVTFPEEMRKFVREGSQAVVTAADSQNMPQAVSERVAIQTVADHTMSGNAASGIESGTISGGVSGGMSGGTSGGISGGSFTVTVNLSADHFQAGEMATLKVEAQASNYGTCVPAGALHLMSDEQYYVNVAEKRSTILGEEWVVRQVNVELLEKNEKYAAVEGISSEQEIVTESSRILEDGSRVNMKNEK